MEEKRFEVSTDEEVRYFTTYAQAFKYYMKVRDDVSWIIVFDCKKQEYLIRENV